MLIAQIVLLGLIIWAVRGDGFPNVFRLLAATGTQALLFLSTYTLLEPRLPIVAVAITLLAVSVGVMVPLVKALFQLRWGQAGVVVAAWFGLTGLGAAIYQATR